MRISDWSSDVCSSDLIGWLQFNADALAAHAGGTIDFAANAKEWRQNRIAGVAPQVDASLDHVELQRRNMALIVAIPTATILQCPRLVYRSAEHTSELQSLMRISYAVLCLTKKRSSTTTA